MMTGVPGSWTDSPGGHPEIRSYLGGDGLTIVVG